jgi:hypothetical protein
MTKFSKSELIDSINYDNIINKDEALEIMNSHKEFTREYIYNIILSNVIINQLYQSIKDTNYFNDFISKINYEYVDEMIDNTNLLQNVFMEKCNKDPNAPINFIGDKILMNEKKPDEIDSLFIYIKYYGLPILRLLSWANNTKNIFLKILCTLLYGWFAFFINILEATFTDLFYYNFNNFKAGLLLALSIPLFMVKWDLKNGLVQDNLSYEFVQLYISWNTCFVYGLKNYTKPLVYAKLIACQIQSKYLGTFMFHRTNTLMTYMGQVWRIFKNDKFINRVDSGFMNSDTNKINRQLGLFNYQYAKNNLDKLGNNFISRIYIKIIIYFFDFIEWTKIETMVTPLNSN